MPVAIKRVVYLVRFPVRCLAGRSLVFSRRASRHASSLISTGQSYPSNKFFTIPLFGYFWQNFIISRLSLRHRHNPRLLHFLIWLIEVLSSILWIRTPPPRLIPDHISSSPVSVIQHVTSVPHIKSTNSLDHSFHPSHPPGMASATTHPASYPSISPT